MNLFLLSWDPKVFASRHINKHVGKMLLEITQMMYTAWHILHPGGEWMDECPVNKKGERGYKRISNINHPMAVWVRSSVTNYMFAARLAIELGEEFERRYKHPHASLEHARWLAEHIPECVHNISLKSQYGFLNLEDDVEPVPLCMPDAYHDPDPVVAYNKYYVGEKLKMA